VPILISGISVLPLKLDTYLLPSKNRYDYLLKIRSSWYAVNGEGESSKKIRISYEEEYLNILDTLPANNQYS
jgi:hypothetical protein